MSRRSATAAWQEDHRLVETFLANGDERAFGEIYRQHGSVLYAFAHHLLQRDSAVEDVVQEAWLRALRRLRSFDGRCSLRTFLIGFVVRCCYETWRTERRQGVGQGGEFEESVEAPAAKNHEKVDLERALARLAPGYRTVLLLHDLHGMTHIEIGALLEIAPGTSKSQLARARHVMRTLWTGGVLPGGDHEG